MSEKSYILKFTQETPDGKISFIFNRGDDYVYNNVPFKLRCWWNYPDVTNLPMFGQKIQKLETLPYDNSNLQHQGIINKYKREYIQKHNETYGEDDVLCNEVLTGCIREISKSLKFNYCKIFNTVERMKYSEIYETVKRIWWDSKLKKMLGIPRYKMLEVDPYTMGVKNYCVMMVFRDYLYDRAKKGMYMPLGPNKPYNEIHDVMSTNKLMKKFKITSYYED